MSSNFSANQVNSLRENGKKLHRPSAHVGHTSFIVNSRGHLGLKRTLIWPYIRPYKGRVIIKQQSASKHNFFPFYLKEKQST
uniref:Uncharacterized protein n=1 Tax=Poecilia latipinna TaxID=48699 RepID=A0A3B3TVT4_9TELE